MRALKKSGKVGDGEKEVRRRVGFFFLSFFFLFWREGGLIDGLIGGG